MTYLITNLSIGVDSFKDALYWWKHNELPAFWVELNSGYYQLHPKEFAEVMLGEGYADVVYTIDGGVYTNQVAAASWIGGTLPTSDRQTLCL